VPEVSMPEFVKGVARGKPLLAKIISTGGERAWRKPLAWLDRTAQILPWAEENGQLGRNCWLCTDALADARDRDRHQLRGPRRPRIISIRANRGVCVSIVGIGPQDAV
jgi:hypothetical protein